MVCLKCSLIVPACIAIQVVNSNTGNVIMIMHRPVSKLLLFILAELRDSEDSMMIGKNVDAKALCSPLGKSSVAIAVLFIMYEFQIRFMCQGRCNVLSPRSRS